MISIYPAKTADGNTCLSCNGRTMPMGYAMIKNRKANNFTVNIEVDMTDIDKALKKFKEMERISDKVNKSYGTGIC